MSFPLVLKRITATLGVFLVIASGSYFYAISPHHTSAPGGIGRWLARSNGDFGLGNLRVPAAMLYAKAERLFVAENRTDKALYAEVSQLPLMTSLERFRPKFPNSHETALSRRRRMPKQDCVFSLFGECWRQIMKLGTRVIVRAALSMVEPNVRFMHALEEAMQSDRRKVNSK